MVDVVGRQMGVDGQFDAHVRLGFGLLTAELRHGFTDESDVEVEADAFDVSGLLTAEQVAGSADLEVLHRHLHSGTQFCVCGQGRQTVVCGLGQLCIRRVEEVRVGTFTSTSHSSAQLVELGESVAVGVVDDEGVRIGDVDSGFDDRRAHEHVVLLLPEVDDDLFESGLVHLAVGDGDPGLGHHFGDMAGDGFDIADPVVDVEDLTFAHELTSDRGLDLLVFAFAHIRQHRVPLFRRCGQGRHLADAGHGHLQGARDRGRRHGEDVDVRPQRLERLLVFDAEALLLVDDDESEFLETHFAAEQSVRADDEVELAVGQIFLDLLRFLFGLEPGKGADGDGESRVAFGEGLIVLLDEQSGRHEHGDLLAFLDCLERGTDSDLGLSVTHVAADQTVHRHGLLHVRFDLVDGGQLIGGLDIVEGVLEFALPGGVRSEGVTDGGLAGRIEADELSGDLLNGLAGLRLRRLPVGAAHLVEARALAADIAGDLVERIAGDVEAVAWLSAFGGRVFDDEVFAGVLVRTPARGPLRHLDESSDTVLVVDDIVAGCQVERVDLVASTAGGQLAHIPRRGGRRPTEHIGLGEHGEFEVFEDESAEGSGRRHGDQCFGQVCGVIDEGCGHSGFGEHLDHASARSLTFGEHEDAPLVVDEALDVGEDRFDIAGIALRDASGNGEDVLLGARELLVGGESADLPPGQADEASAFLHFGHGAEACGRQVDRGLSPTGGSGPGGFEEFVRRLHEVRGAGLDAFGFGDDDLRPCRQQSDDRLHPVGEDGGERFHAFDGDSAGDLIEHIGGAGYILGEVCGPLAHRIGQEQLPARRCRQAQWFFAVFGRDGALVADGEFADLVDFVAEELHAQRPLRGGREDIDDSAAHSEFAAPGDHVDAGVREFGEPFGQIIDLIFVADGELDRFDVAEPLGQGLEEGAHGRDDEGQFPTGSGVSQAAQHLETLTDGVRTRGQLLVRQGLPAGEDRDRRRRHPVGECLSEVFGLTCRGGDDELRRRGGPVGGDGSAQDRRPQSLDRIDRATVGVRVVEGRDEFGDGGIPAGEIKSVEHPNSLGYAPDTTHSVPDSTFLSGA